MVLKPYILKRTADIPLRKALFKRLSAALGSTPVFNGNANPDQPYPYVVIGESIDGPDVSTKTSEGDNRVIMFHCYTQEDGYDQVQALKEQVLAAFQEPLDLEDNTWHLYSIELAAGGRVMRFSDMFAQAAFNMRFKLQSTLT